MKVEKEPLLTKCPCCGEKFIEIYYDGVDPPIPPEKMYEGLVDDYGEWYKVHSVHNSFIFYRTKSLTI